MRTHWSNAQDIWQIFIDDAQDPALAEFAFPEAVHGWLRSPQSFVDHFAPVERDALRGGIRTLVGDALANGTIDFMLRSYAQSLAREGREARLRAVAEALRSNPEDAEGAFALAAAIAVADDHVAPSEDDLIRRFAEWLELDERRASAILNDLIGQV